MRKWLVLPMAAFLVAGLAWAGHAAEYDRYDRYERGYRAEPPPPPPRAAAPARQRHAQEGEPYFFGHIGAYDPNADAEGLRGYDSGFAFDLGIGSRVSPVFAVEGAFGAFSAEAGDDEVSVVPLTIGLRFIVPSPVIEPYLGAGLGIYFSGIDDAYLGIDDDSTDFGGYMSLGMDFWLSPRVALNLEGKYHWVEAEFTDVWGYGRDVDLSGWTVNFGVRVSF
jgi:opacity protein-like surface antigen